MTTKEGCLTAWIICFVGWTLGYATAYFIPPRDNGEIFVVEEQTITESTIATTSTTETTTSTTVSTTVATTTSTTYEVTELTDTMTYLGSYIATYYKGDTFPCYGGSGRILVSCYEKSEWYKGSVASRWVYEQYGYNVNTKTVVYIEFDNYPRMNGWYSVDDCNDNSGIVDFYFDDYSTCPWQNDGITGVKMWISEFE